MDFLLLKNHICYNIGLYLKIGLFSFTNMSLFGCDSHYCRIWNVTSVRIIDQWALRTDNR